MYSYIVRRLAFGAVTVVGVSIVVFIVMRVLPGDPLIAIFGPEGFTKLTAAQRANYMAELGLSDPLVLQYLHWVGDIARGAGLIFMAVAAPVLAPYPPLKSDFRHMSKPPNPPHYFGTDQIGRDTLSRVILWQPSIVDRRFRRRAARHHHGCPVGIGVRLLRRPFRHLQPADHRISACSPIH